VEEIEATGIPGFLAGHPPFSNLSRPELRDIASSSLIEFFPAGDPILVEKGEPAHHVYVIRRGAVELTSGGATVDLLGEGEVFGHPSVLSGRPPLLGARAHEDTICLLLPAEEVAAAFGTRSGLGFLVESLRRRGEVMRSPPLFRAMTAASLVRRPVVEVGEDDPVGVVARKMTESQVTGVLVAGDTGPGIVTDADLRERVLGAGLGHETPVGAITTRPVRVAAPQTLAEVALVEMLDQGLSHLPISGGHGYVGMLELGDLVGGGLLGPFSLRLSIDSASSSDELVSHAAGIPSAIASLSDFGVAARRVGMMVASLTDALTRAAIRLATADLGEPPYPWVWLALGSQARQEQGMLTDQDHALLYAPGGAEEDGWYAKLAGRVVTTLEACGIPRCPNGVMASESGWRAELGEWVEQVAASTRAHDHKATLFAGIALDHRIVIGDLDAAGSLEEMRKAAVADSRFVVRTGELAVAQQIPIGFFGKLVVRELGDHQRVLDIKAGGLHPVVELARYLALVADVPALATTARIEGAADAGVIDAEDGEGVNEAFDLLLGMRLQHQVDNWRIGSTPDNLIDPETLGPLSRAQLRDAFGIVREVQRDVARQIEPRFRG
jgi:CBS domain-containing protein